MVKNAAIALVFVLFTAINSRAEPVTLTFILNIQGFGGPNPELASSVFGERPEVGSTMRAVAQLNPHDRQPDPNYGEYVGEPYGYNVGSPLIAQALRFTLSTPLGLPPSTFSSDAIPLPQALAESATQTALMRDVSNPDRTPPCRLLGRPRRLA